MKLIDMQSSKDSLARRIFRLLRALPPSEQIPKFGDLQEHCVIIITPLISL